MSEEREQLREVHEPKPFKPNARSAWHQPTQRPLDPRKAQEEVQQLLRRLALVVGRVPGQQVMLTHEFMAQLFVEGPRLQISSDPMRQMIVLQVSGGELLQGHAVEGD